jgi:hypothetical protein
MVRIKLPDIVIVWMATSLEINPKKGGRPASLKMVKRKINLDIAFHLFLLILMILSELDL